MWSPHQSGELLFRFSHHFGSGPHSAAEDGQYRFFVGIPEVRPTREGSSANRLTAENRRDACVSSLWFSERFGGGGKSSGAGRRAATNWRRVTFVCCILHLPLFIAS